MKKTFIALFFTTSLMAIQAEQAYLYKDTRLMGMGGVDIAIGAYSTSLFSNPSGLARLKKSDGLIVDLLGLGVAATQGVQDLTSDVADTDDDPAALEDVLQKYKGDNFHLGISNYSSLSKNSDMFIWSLGVLAVSDTNMMAHSNGTSSGDFIETSSRVYGGLVLGIAKPYYSSVGRIDMGLGFKYINQTSYEGTVGVFDYTDTDNFFEKYEKKASGLGIDLGVTYHLVDNKFWHLALASSVMNIGLDLDDNYGNQPMTVNLGVAVTTRVSFISRLVLGVDYVDILGANKYREYEQTANGTSTNYTDYDTFDFIKNLRIGTRMTLAEHTEVSFGIYQSAYTVGLNVQLSAFELTLATYQEDVGISSDTSNTDRRYMAQLGIDW